MAPISLECTAAAVNVDGLGRWDQGLTALKGCNLGGLVLRGMLVSKTLVWGHTEVCNA